MGIVSIGEVVGSVTAGATDPEHKQAEEEGASAEGAAPHVTHPEDLERELRVRAWRRTRLHAD